MDKAWVSYDLRSGKILSIRWKPNADALVEISKELALEFMEGSKSIESYRILKIDGEITLSKLETAERTPIFWSLDSIEDASDIQINDDGLVIDVSNGIPVFFRLFATLSNDPSWLITSWNLTDMPVDQDRIFVRFPAARQHSFYLSRIDEI